MIEINLARHLQVSPIKKSMFKPGFEWVAVVLCLGIGVASWGWTYIQQEEYGKLLQLKYVQTQSLDKINTTLGRLKQVQEEKQELHEALDTISAQKVGKRLPMVVLDRVSRSIDGLEMWLDRVQMVDQVVELRGQSLALKDIGEYLDALENHQGMIALPIVEILDHKDKESGTVFSFMIRFVVGQQVTT